MKKILSCFLLLLILVSSLSLPAFAASQKTDKITISEDFKTIYYKGEEYLEEIDSDLSIDTTDKGYENTIDYEYIEDFHFLGNQKDKIDSIYASIYTDYICIDFCFKQGGEISFYYQKKGLEKEFKELHKSGKGIYEIDSDYTGSTLEISKNRLFKNPVKFKGYELNYMPNYVGVFLLNKDKTIGCNIGDIYIDEETLDFYFYDAFQYSKKGNYESSWDAANRDEVILYKITDKEICKKLEDDYRGDDDMVLPTEEDISENFALIVLGVIFVLIPLILLIFTIIFAIRSKRPYKTCFILTSATCAIVLIVAAWIVSIFI